MNLKLNNRKHKNKPSRPDIIIEIKFQN